MYENISIKKKLSKNLVILNNSFFYRLHVDMYKEKQTTSVF